jgi:hypothetical protein
LVDVIAISNIFGQFGILYGHFVVIWYILWLFGIICGYLLYFVVIWYRYFLVIWYIFWLFGIFFGHLVYFWSFGVFLVIWYVFLVLVRVVPRKNW